MKMKTAVDAYLTDAQMDGRIRSENTLRSYRYALWCHAEDVNNRDPRYTNREDIKKTLRRWRNPNSQRPRRSALLSFYEWLEEEGIRKDNPVRQVRRPKTSRPDSYRMTRSEVWDFLNAAQTEREKRIAYIGCCAGLRVSEICGLQGRHFSRPGFIWVSSDIAKGQIERYVAITEDLEPIAEDIIATVDPLHFVIPHRDTTDPGWNQNQRENPERPTAVWSIAYIVEQLGKRAGITTKLTPHLMRHAYGDNVSRYAGMKNTQALMGHASIATTEGYVGRPSLDELAVSLRGFTYRPTRTSVPGSALSAVKPAAASESDITGGIAVPAPRAESWSSLSDLTFTPGPLVLA